MLAERPIPREGVLIARINERPIDIQENDHGHQTTSDRPTPRQIHAPSRATLTLSAETVAASRRAGCGQASRAFGSPPGPSLTGRSGVDLYIRPGW
jgi:hypothetical protein